MEWLTEFTNSPIFITLSSIFSVLGSILIIIGKTSFGKKAIAKLTDMTNQTKADVENIKAECKSSLDEVKTALNTLEAEKETYKKELDTQVRVYFNQFSFYETQMFDTLSQIPNAKVQEKLEILKANWESQKAEIEKVIGIGQDEINAKMSELEEMKKQVQELLDKLEVQDNGNDQATEEQI